MSAACDQIIVIDFETKWSKADYTLSKMTTEEYIRDPRFKAYGACLKVYGLTQQAKWYNGTALRDALSMYDWSRTAILAHNAQFDVSILEWVYDVHPCFIFDTLSMARALRGVEVGNSLMKLAADFGLPPKGNAVHSTDGLQGPLPAHIEKELADYCVHDTFLCEEIFKRLIVGYPASELRLIDMTLRMYTQPKLVLDEQLLFDSLALEKEKRERLLAKLNIDEAALASNKKFAEILNTLGVAAPYKVSKSTGLQALALAKTDAHFQALLNGDNDEVALLCEARLAVKSTTERTRAQRFLDIAARGTLPVPLSYYGALSGRWTASKGSAINMQNLKRGSFLRNAIMAPEGYKIVVGDLSQIEPRVLAWLADYDDMLDIFRSGEDAYAQFGSQMFSIPGMTKYSHPKLRQSAKSALIGAGYQLGWASFAAQLLVGFLGAPPVRYDKAFAKSIGVDRKYVDKFLGWEDNITKMSEIPHICTNDELLIHCVAAKKIIDIYRATAHPVERLWELYERLIVSALFGGVEHTHKCLIFRKEEIELPNGMKLLYPNLRREHEFVIQLDGTKKKTSKLNWVYGENATKLYPGKIANNTTQAVARIVMTDGMLRVSKRLPLVLTVHDELGALARDEDAEEELAWVLQQMTKEPKYMPGIPLAAEGGTHQRYGKAKS